MLKPQNSARYGIIKQIISMRRTIKISLLSLIAAGLTFAFISGSALAATATTTTSSSGSSGLNVCSGSAEDYQALQTWLIGNPEPVPNDPRHQQWQISYNKFLSDHPGICQAKDIYGVIAKITNFLIGFAGAFAVLRMLFGGYLMVGFPGDESAAKKANEILVHSFYGLIMVYGSYIAVNFFFVKFGVTANFPFPFNFFQK